MNPLITAISTQTLAYAPAVFAGVQVAETAPAAGATKLQAVVNGVLAGSAALESAPNPDVAGIAALANLFVSILNGLGVFAHKPKAQPQTVTVVTAAPAAAAVV